MSTIKPKSISRPKESSGCYADYLHQDFHQKAPNLVWTSDFTYLKAGGKWYYLRIIMDLFSRKIISWNISSKPNADLVIQTFQKAYHSRNCPAGLMFHSDRGSQCTAFAFRKLLDNWMLSSPSRKRDILLITPAAKVSSNISKKKKPTGVIFVPIVTYTTLSSNISKASITRADHMVL